VTSTSTDTLGNVSDSASTSGSITVSVAAVGDAPGIAIVGGGSGDEDTVIPIGITVTPVGGEAITSVVVSGVPAGAALSLGTDNGDGSWTIAGDDLTSLSELTMTPVANYSGTPTLGVVVETNEGGTNSIEMPVTVVAVADAPTLAVTVGEATETEGGFLPDIDAFPHDISNIVMYLDDGTGEITKVKVEDFPGDGLNDVNDLGIEAFLAESYPGTTLVGLTVKAGDNHTPGFGPGEGELVYVADGTTQADLPVADHADDEYAFNDSLEGLDPSPIGGEGGQSYPLEITSNLVDTDGSETLSVTVSGVPDGASLSAGTDNGDGTWTLAPDQLSGLSVAVTDGVTADFNLTVTATATEPNGDTASVSQSVTVDAVSEAPDVTTTAASGNEDTAIALDISAGADGASIASVVVSNVPDGASLSAGTDNGDGTWTLNGDQLGDLTITPPQNYSGSIDLGVTATSPEGTTSTATLNVAVEAVADAPNLTTGIGDADASRDVDYSNVSFGPGDNNEKDDDDGKHDGKDDDKDDADGKYDGKGDGKYDGKGDGKYDGKYDGKGDGKDDDDLSGKDDVWAGDSKGNEANGGKGDDALFGKGGDDDLSGGDGGDLLFGGAGDDTLAGGSGDDVIFGGSGGNVIEGGSGDDFLIGGSGNDDIRGGDDADVIFAGGGNDKVDGGNGNDVMVLSGAREDYLFTEMPGTSGQYVIEHLDGGSDGVNLVENIESFQFTDGQFGLGNMMGSNPDDHLLLTYDISIDTGLTDTDGSEALSDITISGVPGGATFSAGTDNGDGSWSFGEADLSDLTLQVDENVQQDFSLNVSVSSTETSNGDVATSTSVIDVALPEDVNIEGDNSVDALDPLAAMFDDSDTLSFEGEEYDISSLTDGDSNDDYAGITPLGGGTSSGGDHDTSYQDESGDGYSSSESGPDDLGGDDNNNC